VCRAFPRAASYHNRAAWLAARCGTHLDDALVHADQACRLEPGNWASLDTLAEVYFQRGETERAITTIREALRQSPENPYLRGQIARFESGDRSTNPPPAP
jgi:cytochrome c-type biogenesis protein CcmH/NrfG